MDGLFLIHYAEIGTKGGNRKYFEHALARNIRKNAPPGAIKKVAPVWGRIVLEPEPGADLEALRALLRRTFGVAWFGWARRVPREPAKLRVEVLRVLKEEVKAAPASFKIEASRSDPAYPMSAGALHRELGQDVVDAFGWKVDLDEPALTVRLQLTTTGCFLLLEKEKGPGGLPVGTQGPVLSLLSGGLDSPVASWMLLRRGARVSFMHVHPYRGPRELAGAPIVPLFEKLGEWGGGRNLYLVPAYHFMAAASMSVDPALEIVAFRRFLFQAADELARRQGFEALVAGDSLGQVASQTLENIRAASARTDLPVFRPLIGMDKHDIVARAEAIGTFELSTRPYKDCCSLIRPKPRTRVPLELALKADRQVGMAARVEEALAECRVLRRGEPLEEAPLLSELVEARKRKEAVR